MSHSSLGAVVALTALVLPQAAVAQDVAARVALHGSSLDAPPHVAALLHPFSGGPDPNRVTSVLLEQNLAVGFPVDAHDEVLIARLWRLSGAPEQALATLAAIPPPEAGSLVSLERARTLLEADLDRAAGARAYWAACESPDTGALEDIRYDLLAVSTPDERAAWEEEPAAAFSDCDWLREFWSERANRMAISTDERLALHYRRLAQARDWYWIPRPRVAQSWADKRGRPDGLAIDDRGLMYVRMGPPETREGFIGEGVDVSYQLADVGPALTSYPETGFPDDLLDLRQCWPYPRPDGYRIFCFSQTSVSGQARADADYKLLEDVAATPGTQFYHKYVKNSNLPDSYLRSRLRARTIGFGLRDSWEADLDRVEVGAYDQSAAFRTRDNIEAAVAGIPDVPAVFPTARLRAEALRFLNPDEGRWEVWTLASVRAGDLTASPDETGVPTLVAGGRFSVLQDADVEVHELAPQRIPASGVSDDDGLMFHSVFDASPGRLPLTVVIEDGNRPNGGNYLQTALNVPAIGGLPMLSDIAVARETGGDWTRDGETFLRITPAHVVNADGSIHTYFEVYQLRPGSSYDVEIRLAPVELTDEILRLDPSELDFRLQFTSEMTGEVGRHHLRLELGGAAPGEYSLAVRIQDVATGAYSLPSITEVFVPRDGGGR